MYNKTPNHHISTIWEETLMSFISFLIKIADDSFSQLTYNGLKRGGEGGVPIFKLVPEKRADMRTEPKPRLRLSWPGGHSSLPCAMLHPRTWQRNYSLLQTNAQILLEHAARRVTLRERRRDAEATTHSCRLGRWGILSGVFCFTRRSVDELGYTFLNHTAWLNKSMQKQTKEINLQQSESFQQHVINRMDRCYLLSLKRGVKGPVIFPPHTHLLRQVQFNKVSSSTRTPPASCAAHGRFQPHPFRPMQLLQYMLTDSTRVHVNTASVRGSQSRKKTNLITQKVPQNYS